MRIIATCGGFDPVHEGHIELFRKAKSLGGKLFVILNNDNWLKSKKGYVLLNEDSRKKIIESIRYVDKVIISKHKPNTKDLSICCELRRLKPDILAKGGDRNRDNIPETELCDELGIKIVDGLGKKLNSSSKMLKRHRSQFK